MEYQPLKESTIIDYLKKRPAIAERIAKGEPYTINEVGDGNLNLVFILNSGKDDGLSFPDFHAHHVWSMIDNFGC